MAVLYRLALDKGCDYPAGFWCAGMHAGIKKTGVPDLGLIYSKTPCSAAACFTTNAVKAAPVQISKKHISNPIYAVVANSGNANCMTGEKGLFAAAQTAVLGAHALELPDSKHVLVASTGRIGVQFPVDKIGPGITELAERVKNGQSSALDFARAVLTTDTKEKVCGAEIDVQGGRRVRIGACVKGAGMIQPSMATMLCFITTDAAMERKVLQAALKKAVERSFNRISVDGDMSTNDTVFLLANGACGAVQIDSESPHLEAFTEALTAVCYKLARDIVLDGEGATRLVKINVKGGAAVSDCRAAAFKIANSMLFKCAVYGNDVNWGRVGAAAGASGADIQEEKLSIYFDGLCVFKNGEPQDVTASDKEKLAYRKEWNITVVIGGSRNHYEVMTCDLTHKYVDINMA